VNIEWLCGGSGKHHAVAWKHRWLWVFVHAWLVTRLAVDLDPWYLARAKALSAGLSDAYFKSLGLPTLIDGVQA